MGKRAEVKIIGKAQRCKCKAQGTQGRNVGICGEFIGEHDGRCVGGRLWPEGPSVLRVPPKPMGGVDGLSMDTR